METKDPESIEYAAYNPRKMSEHDGHSLTASMTKFGDISGITVNEQTNTYVTGHQRMRTLANKFPGLVRINIEQRLAAPDEYGTVATGYVGVVGTPLRFAYREVSWSLATEKTANIAANRIEADWDQQMLAQIDAELATFENGDELLALSGQSEDEVKRLMKQFGPDDEEEPIKDPVDDNTLSFALTKDQREVVEEAINYYKANRDMAAESNSSLNGNALYFMARESLDKLHGEPSDAPAA